MELKEPEQGSTDGDFHTFENVGEVLRGLFVSYRVIEIQGWEKPKKELIIRTKQGMKNIACPVKLALIIQEALKDPHCLDGKVLTITYTGTEKNKYGGKTKLFKVDAAEPSRANATKPAAKPVVEADDNDAAEPDDIPF